MVLKHLFGNKKAKTKTVDMVNFAQILSKKKLMTLQELEQLLFQMQQDNLIEFVANQGKKGYNVTIKITPKGHLFLLSETNRGSDVVVSIFVYLIMFGILMLFVYVIKIIMEGYRG